MKNETNIPETTKTLSPFKKNGVMLKICGMKYQENITDIATISPDYLGFIFYEKSPRFFEGTIPQIPKSIKKVGVFVDADVASIIEKIKDYQLDIVQLHGDEDALYVTQLNKVLKSSFPDVQVWKVFAMDTSFDFDKLNPFENKVDAFLFDTKGKQPGGNGLVFNWDVLKNYPSKKPFILSGGIGLDEIESLEKFLKSAVSKYCYAIDINSKFEIEPGLKDIEKLKELKSHAIISNNK